MELNITVEEVVVICDKLLALKDRPSVSNSRMVLFRQFNGDVFYKQSLGPRRYRQLSFKKPLTDLDTLKLMLFLLGNGAAPHLTIEWVLSAQFWSDNQVAFVKRTHQIKNKFH